jgi:hypothetical protein
MTNRPIPGGNLRSWAAIVWSAAIFVGCGGSDRTAVSGQVLRHDGSPLTGARVTARSNATGAWASGTTDQEGRFELGVAEKDDGIAPGEYYVIISEERVDFDSPAPHTIPDRYGDPEESEIHFTAEAGEHVTLDIKLKAS